MAAPSAAVLVVPGFAAQFVAGGGRDIETGRWPEAAALAAGTHVRLLDAGSEEVGLAIADPDNQRLRVLAVPADGFPAIDGALLGWRVERALALRRQLGLTGPAGGNPAGSAGRGAEPGPAGGNPAGSAGRGAEPWSDAGYRIVHGAGDGLPGFAADVLGRVAVVYAYGDGLRALGKQLAEAIVGFARLDGAVVKLRARGGAGDVPQDVIGTVPERVLARENGLVYEIHPLGGLNAGLFTDMREHRLGLARFASGARVLNLFSYTGALGLACARAGAASVTNVDTSTGVQAWARGNFARAGFTDDARYKFEVGDAIRYLQRAARDKERYDLVVIDPPSMSTARGQPWALGRDYPELIALAASVVPRDGLLWLASNTHELGSLGKLAHKGLRETRRAAAILETGGLPPEYPTVAAQPSDRYLQVCLLRLG